MKQIPLLLFFISILTHAQEAKYKQALDSIAQYIEFTRFEKKMHLVTYYNPNTYSNMSETTDSLTYIKMAYNYKTKVVFTDSDIVYMIDFKEADTTFFGYSRKGLRIKDPAKKVMFRNSNTARLFNGKIGGVDIDQIDLDFPYSTEYNTYLSPQNLYNLNKLIYFLKQATLYSKKVKTKKKDIWVPKGYA